jgi:hypothetical protein
VAQVLNRLKNFWPLTLRQIYYQLVAAETIQNHISQYKKLSRVLAQGRLEGLVPWEALEDRSRSMLHSGGWSDKDAFISREQASFLRGYRRDMLQGQEVALEVWVEKDALSRVCHDATFPYCVPVVVARGFGSISYVRDLYDRIQAAQNRGQEMAILYFGDMDPSGYEMLPSMMQTIEEDMGASADGIRCALTVEQINAYQLPHSPDALKWTDSRAQKYVSRFGELAVELDALPPDTLQAIIRKSIESHLDMGLLEYQRELQAEEREELAQLKDKVETYIDQER